VFADAITPHIGRAKTDAPTGLRPILERTTAIAAETSTSGAMPDFSEPTAAAPISETEAWVHADCGFQDVDVRAVGTRFEGVPCTLRTGTTSSALTDEGGPGPLVVGILVRPKGPVAHRGPAARDGAEEMFAAVDAAPAAAVAAPGVTGGAIVELTPGRWFHVRPSGTEEGGVSADQEGMLAASAVT
jgi:hypothetical protein